MYRFCYDLTTCIDGRNAEWAATLGTWFPLAPRVDKVHTFMGRLPLPQHDGHNEGEASTTMDQHHDRAGAAKSLMFTPRFDKTG